MKKNGKAKFCFVALLLLAFNSQAQSGFSEHRLESAGQTRTYRVYLPESHQREAVPLVFSFHGSGGVPQNQVDTSHFDILAERHGFVAVFPAGAFTNTVTARSWNANREAGVDDVQLVRDIIEDVAGYVNIDRSRIYVSGMSGGGRISSRLACELSDILAAAAPVAGLQYPDGCLLKRPVPIITFHGMADAVNQYLVSEKSRPYWRMGVETALDKWRQANGCSLINTADRLSQHVMFYSWTDCDDGADIHFYQIDNGGHTWPGSDIDDTVPALGVGNQDIDASELIWAFFSKHRLR
ncbi:MAG: PHB depolymerase family esterase [Pseudomonadales bacterium]|nr:PHB depolymerase family esterase [Pseudomonadales bacterium]